MTRILLSFLALAVSVTALVCVVEVTVTGDGPGLLGRFLLSLPISIGIVGGRLWLEDRRP